MNLDTLISPRYLSAFGKYSDNKLLVLGGYGSDFRETGRLSSKLL